jgi:hypothetical protein
VTTVIGAATVVVVAKIPLQEHAEEYAALLVQAVA